MVTNLWEILSKSNLLEQIYKEKTLRRTIFLQSSEICQLSILKSSKPKNVLISETPKHMPTSCWLLCQNTWKFRPIYDRHYHKYVILTHTFATSLLAHTKFINDIFVISIPYTTVTVLSSTEMSLDPIIQDSFSFPS